MEMVAKIAYEWVKIIQNGLKLELRKLELSKMALEMASNGRVDSKKKMTENDQMPNNAGGRDATWSWSKKNNTKKL